MLGSCKWYSASSSQAHKNMLAAQSYFLENISDNMDMDPSSGSSQEGSTENLVRPSVARRRANLQEVENGYITVSQLFFFFLLTTQKNDFKFHLICSTESKRIPCRPVVGV